MDMPLPDWAPRGADAPALSIVVPVYNGAATVGALVAALETLEVPGGLEIVLVNDGSPDNSGEVCRALLGRSAVPITYVEHARNYGEHNAVMTGLRHARGAYVITMDDDLQNPPEEVVRLFLHTRDGGYDVVYTRYAEKKHEGWRNLGSRFANRVADILIDKPRGLYLSSFRCMSRVVVDGVTRYEGPFPYVDGLIMQVTQRIGSLEVMHLPRAHGVSNYTLRRLVRLWLNLAVNFSLLPLRFAVFAGVAMAGLGALGALYVIIHALTGEQPQGWASTMVVILLVSGVQFVILGILGEYLGRTFMTGNRRPQGIVRTVAHGEPVARVGRR
ncbi:glycosyltransferase family 2 protein [Elioraea rosea]|uniref:glycosyltransferase family 2 protein n=1 Tax=Elioraea rosea TaxID=2492390 RepID=UPI00118207A8|nr:glycosyltransferase family 2 protein [Elioraea rosea]